MSRVSVIIPTYNRARMLRQAIRSVLAQTYQDFELIVVDDGSTDDTRETVASFTDPRIRYIWQENQERSVARNNGVRETNGDLIAFLDSDDVWLPCHLATLVGMMDRYPEAVLAYGSILQMDDQNRLLSPLPLLNQSDEPVVCDCRDEIIRRFITITSALILRRKAIEEVGGFDTRLSLVEDWDLWIRVSELGPFCGVRSPVSVIREHASRSINDVAAMVMGHVAAIERAAARRGVGFDGQVKIAGELFWNADYATYAVDLNLTEASELISDVLDRLRASQDEHAIRNVFAGYRNVGILSLRECHLKARRLETLVRHIDSLGGSESRRIWLASFWASVVHAGYAIGDNRLAVQALPYLIACGGIGIVDRGVFSAAVRAAIALARHPGAERKPLPGEKEIAAFLLGLRDLPDAATESSGRGIESA